MTADDPLSRRKILQLTGIAGTTALVAGCADEGPGEEPADDEEPQPDDPEEEDVDEPDEEPDEEEDDEPEEEEEEDDEPEEEEEEEEEDDEEDEADGEAIEPGEIVLEGHTAGWIGTEPDEIAGDENPTLTLQEGETYDFTWTNEDGARHNIEIRDEDGEVVDDYQTDVTDDDEQTLEDVEVTDEMAQYVCEPHETTMVGDIEVE